MKKITAYFLTLIILLFSCEIGTGLASTSEIPYTGEVPESFDKNDKPVYQDILNETEDYRLLTPWNYNKAYNANRNYPLVVSLHGSGGNHYAPCIVNDEEEMKKFPCFFLSPTCSNWGSDAAWVRDLMERLIHEYRIDVNRIYVMGFSMGGSGSYSFAKAFYSEKGRIVAGIVRLAGQSQTSLPDEMAEKTSVWYHIGLLDNASRVETADDTYAFMKTYRKHLDASEYVQKDELSVYPRTTYTLVKNGIAFMKLSRYEEMGHDGGTAFRDPAVLEWLFNQSLAKR